MSASAGKVDDVTSIETGGDRSVNVSVVSSVAGDTSAGVVVGDGARGGCVGVAGVEDTSEGALDVKGGSTDVGGGEDTEAGPAS